jgi:hypothetical protein
LGATVLRIHLDLSLSWLTSDTSPAVIASIIVQDKQFGIVPTTDLQVPWLLYRMVTPGRSEQSMVNGTSILAGDVFDIRAKRRLPQLNDTLQFRLSNLGSASVAYTINARTLVMLH